MLSGRRRALMKALEVGPVLPEGYRRVTYINVQGSSLSTTHYFPRTKVTFKVKYTLDASRTSEGYLFGDRASTGVRLAIGTSSKNSTTGLKATGIIGGLSARPTFTPTEPENMVEATMTVGAPDTTSYMEFDGTIDGTHYNVRNEGTTRPYGLITIKLFDVNGSARFYGKLYKLEVYSNDALYFNFVPCVRESDNTPGVYEVVTGNFYGDKSHITAGG